jgi:heparan-alpha-glucosaminide N-acetyltransferase
MVTKNNRISAIDIMKGLTLFLMLFVNDLYILGVPNWLVHTGIQEVGIGLADWVFPGVLFMVGLYG